MAALAALAGFSAACSSSPDGMIASFLDISSEVEGQGWIDANQNRLMSLAGLLVHNEAGQLLRYKNSRSPTTAISLASSRREGSSGPQSAVPSKIIAISTGSQVTVEDVRDLRDKLIAVQSKAVALVDARLDLAYARALEIAALEQGGKPVAAEKAQAEALSKSSSVSSADKDYKTLKSEFQAALDAVKRAITKPGLLVTRWTTRSESRGALSLGDILGIDTSSEDMTSGFAIFGGLRTTQLAVGRDFADVQSYVEGGFDLDWRFPFLRIEPQHEDVRLVTYTIETKHIAYVQDFSASMSLGLRLKASYQQLANLGATLREIDKIEIAAAYAKVQDLTNMALLSSVQRREFDAPWNRSGAGDKGAGAEPEPFERLQDSYGKSAGSEDPSKDGWRILYAVDVEMGDLQRHFSSPPKTNSDAKDE